MARQKGIVKIEGTLDDITFYQSQDGSMIRKKTSVNKDRITNDESFLRTRENNEEFANAASAGKLVRDCVRNLTNGTADNRITSRLSKIMMQVKNFDTVHVRGKRTVADGIADPAAQELLRDFDFNIKASVASIMFAPYSLDKASGTITIPGFKPLTGVVAPDGASHVSFQAGFGHLDFLDNKHELQLSPIENLPIDGNTTDVVLKPANVPALPGTGIYLLKVTFFQLVNGVQYALSNNANNAMVIVDLQ